MEGFGIGVRKGKGGVMGGKKVDEVRREDKDIVFSVYC